jgi:hypothetical protein
VLAHMAHEIEVGLHRLEWGPGVRLRGASGRALIVSNLPK